MNGYMGVWSETAGNETCLGLGCVWNNNGCRLWYIGRSFTDTLCE